MGRKARSKPGHKQTKGGGRASHRHQTLKEEQLPPGLRPQDIGSTAKYEPDEPGVMRVAMTTVEGAFGPLTPDERDDLPPVLRDLPEDADIPVIMAMPGDPPPPGAGDELGELNKPMVTPQGVFPEGSPLWLDASKMLGVPPGFVRQATKGQIIIGGQADEGEPGELPLGLQPGDVIATEQPLGFVETGIALPDGTTIQPGAKVYRAESLGGGDSTPMLDYLDRMRSKAGSSGSSLPPNPPQRPLSKRAIQNKRAEIGALAPGLGSSIPPGRTGSYKPKRNAAGQDIIDADTIPGLMARVRAIPGLEDKLRQGMTAQQLKETGPLIARLLSDAGFKHGKRDAVIQFSDKEILAFTERRALTATDVLTYHATLAEEQKHPSEALVTYFDSFMESVYAKADSDLQKVSAWQWLFYPAKDAREFIGILAKQLVDARTYQVTSGMMDAVGVVYDKLRASKNMSWFEKDAVPAPAGFVWFDSPLAFTDAHGLRMMHRALSWSVVTVWTGRDHDETHPHAHHKVGEVCDCPDATAITAVRITTWSHRDDPDDYRHQVKLPSSFLDMLGDLTMGHSVIIPFGQRFALPENLKTTDGHLADDLGRWTYVMFKFFSEELSVTRKEPVGRPARRRAMKSLKSGEVSVIILRKKHVVSDGDGQHRSIEWSCRWPVEGHYRHLEKYDLEVDELGRSHRHQALPYPWDKTHCVTCGSKITFVHPYLKGPTHLPIQQRKQLYKLAR
jgi:hypothetical protein